MRNIISKTKPTKSLNMIHIEKGRGKVTPSQMTDVEDGGRIINKMKYDDLLQEITLTCIKIVLPTTMANPGIDLMTIPMAYSRTRARSIMIKELVPAIQIILLEDKEVAVSPHTQQALIQEEYPLIQLPILRDCQ